MTPSTATSLTGKAAAAVQGVQADTDDLGERLVTLGGRLEEVLEDVLLSPIDGRILTSPIDGRILTSPIDGRIITRP